MAKVLRIWRLHFSYGGRPRDVLRGALLGSILLGAAGAAVAWRWSWGKQSTGGPAVQFLAYDGPSPLWPLGVLLGAAAGATLGAGVTFVGGAAWEQKGSAAAVVAVGLLAGALCAYAWADATASERVFLLQAEPPGFRPLSSVPHDVIESPQVRLVCDVRRRPRIVLQAFLTLCGATIGALAARGVVGPWPSGAALDRPAEGGFQVVTAHRDSSTASPAATSS
ncbi:MAG TPA: hypothetical protein VFB66_23675 [Tepidisphaeraceae bacterium]|nr:hypothetical protein [Tepidisphaeraceae bacterium]